MGLEHHQPSLILHHTALEYYVCVCVREKEMMLSFNGVFNLLMYQSLDVSS